MAGWQLDLCGGPDVATLGRMPFSPRPMGVRTQRAQSGVVLALSVLCLALLIPMFVLSIRVAALEFLPLQVGFVVLLGAMTYVAALNFRDWRQSDPIAALRAHERHRKVSVLTACLIGGVLVFLGGFGMLRLVLSTGPMALILMVLFWTMGLLLIGIGVWQYQRTEKYPILRGSVVFPPGSGPVPPPAHRADQPYSDGHGVQHPVGHPSGGWQEELRQQQGHHHGQGPGGPIPPMSLPPDGQQDSGHGQ